MTSTMQQSTCLPIRTWFKLTILLAVLLVSVYVALSPANRLLNWFDNDDGFYYFVVARNIADGNGITFDGINSANGFHPLWMLVCVPIFAIFNHDSLLPLRVIILVFGVFQAVSMLLLFSLLAKRLPPLLSALLTLLFGFSSAVYAALFSGGLESALSLLGITFLILLTQKYRADQKNLFLLALAGLAAGLTVLSRLDTIFPVAFLGLWCIFDRTEDSVQLFFDIIAACLIVMVSAGLRLGFNLLNFDRTVLCLIVLWSAMGALGNFINGHYSYQPVPRIGRRIPRMLIIHAAVTGVIVTLTWLLAKAGILETWSRAILLYSSVGWLGYTLIKGALPHFSDPEPAQPPTLPFRRTFICWIRKPLAYYLPLLLLLGGYMIWSQIRFGTPMPVSGQIKVWWGSLGSTVYGAPIHSIQTLLEFLFVKGSPFFYLYDFFTPVLSALKDAPVKAGILSWAILAAGFLALLLLGQKTRVGEWLAHLSVFPLATGIFLRLVYFFVTGYVHFRKWYWISETLLVFFLLVTIIGSLWGAFLAKKLFRLAVAGAVLLMVIFSSGSFLVRTASRYSWWADQGETHEYLAVTRSIEENTQPGDVIGIPGGGAIGYFIEGRTVVNLDGLMGSKEYFDLLQKFDTHIFMQEMGIHYVYSHEYVVLGSLPFFKIFDDRLSPILLINNKYLYAYQ